MSKKQVKFFSINLICIFGLFTGIVFGQARPNVEAKNTKRFKPSVIKVKRKTIRTISLGVINGKAIDLVRPEFPKTALAVNAYGQVDVSVVIDETGKVATARAGKGHPFLRAAAVAAALNSTFAPTQISGKSVRVNGTIIYNFLARQWNWLEIGYSLGYGSLNFSYYSTDNLEDEFPAGYSDVSRFINQCLQSSASLDQTVGTIVAMIRGKLSANQRNAWLFEVGLKIGNIEHICCRVEDDMQALGRDIEGLIDSQPSDVSPSLLRNVGRLVFLINNPKEVAYDPIRGNSIYQLLTSMKEKYPYLGR